MNDAKTFLVENAQLIFLNFSGKEGQYNREGDRNFSVFLDDETAKVMLKDGWNVKELSGRDEDEPNRPYIQIAVSYKMRPPKIVLRSSTGNTNLNEETVGVLDWADIKIVDLIARAYEWDVNGKKGIKAYLQSMFVTIEEDALERKYALLDQEDNA